MADGDRSNLGNFPDDLDDDAPLASDAPDSADLNVRDDASDAPTAADPGDAAAPPAAASPPPPPASADELAALRREIEFLRAGQAPPIQHAPAQPAPQADVVGMVKNMLGPWKPSAAEVAEAMADPEKMAELIYNAAIVSTGAGAAMGMQASQRQYETQRSLEQQYQARGEAFRASYPELQKYGTLNQTHAAQVHAELQGRHVAPQVFAAEVAKRVTQELAAYGINPKAETKRRQRPATAERGTHAGPAAPAPRGSKRKDQISKFLGLH